MGCGGWGARAGGGVCTYLALCPGSASPHRFQSAHAGSQHSDVFPGRFLRQVAPQAGSSDEPLIVLIQLKLKNNVEWKRFKKRNNTYVHKNPTTHVLFQDTYIFNRTTETWVKIVFPVFRRVVTFEKERREMDLGVGLTLPVVHFYSFIK